MAAPVWILSVDLQTKSATFTTGLADAAKSARGSFNNIKSGAGEMSDAVSYSTMEARHSVMMLGEEFGVHLPRSLTTFIAGLGPIGPALEAAFPFLAVILGATLLIEHLVKLHEAGEKLTDDQMKFGTAVQNAFNTLDMKLIQAQIRSDELKNDHLGALKLQLELIDKQSMAELAHSFEELAKTSDAVMKDIEAHWYTLGKGSDGAQHGLDDFGNHYADLLAKGDKEKASGLLQGTLGQAQKALAALQQMQSAGGAHMDNPFAAFADPAKFHEAEAQLQQLGIRVGASLKDQIAAQQIVVDKYNAQVHLAQQLADLSTQDGKNNKKQTGNAGAAQASSAAQQAAASQQRIAEQGLAGDRATADAAMTIKRASIEDRLASDIGFAEKDRDIKEAANAAEIAGLNKSGAQYQNELKAHNEKALEITAEYAAKVAELKAHAAIEENNRDLTALRQSEAEKIEEVRGGAIARLAVIDAAIKEEESKNLQDTNYFRDLMKQRAAAARDAADDEGKLREAAAKEEAEAGEKAGMQGVAALKQAMAVANSIRTASVAQRIAQETNIADQEYAIKMVELRKEIDGLDKNGKEYAAKLKQLLDQQKQLIQQNALDVSAIRTNAQTQTDDKLQAEYGKFTDTISSDLTKVIMGHETMAHMLQSLGESMISNMIENTIKYIMSNKFRQESDAKTAAAAAFNWASPIGGPILGAIAGAAAFAGAMAFEEGGVVPGVGRGDIVPAMLTPGEGIVPKSVMGQLSEMARNGGMSGSTHITNVHVRPTYHVNTVDGDGMQDALDKHTDVLTNHFERTLRKMSR